MNKENFCLTYFISRPFFFGIIYSLLFSLNGSDSLIAAFIGTFLGIIIIALISKMNFNENKFRLIQIITYLFFLVIAFTSIETYASSYLLTKTPKIIIIIPALLLVCYVAFKKMNTLKKASLIFFIMSIASIIFIIFLLSNYLNVQNILPFFTHKPMNIIKGSIIFAIMSAFPNILLKEENISLRKHIIFYLITSLINIIIGFLALTILTPDVAKIYSYPEYMVLKRIKILGFIENVENLSVLIWYFDYFFLITLTLKRIYNIIKKKAVFLGIAILTAIFSTFFIANDFKITIWLYRYCPWVMIVLFLSMCTSVFIKSKSTVKYK